MVYRPYTMVTTKLLQIFLLLSVAALSAVYAKPSAKTRMKIDQNLVHIRKKTSPGECKTNEDCKKENYVCINHSCKCKDGYYVKPDGSCVSKTETNQACKSNSDCTAKGKNTKCDTASKKCVCDDGFSISKLNASECLPTILRSDVGFELSKETWDPAMATEGSAEYNRMVKVATDIVSKVPGYISSNSFAFTNVNKKPFAKFQIIAKNPQVVSRHRRSVDYMDMMDSDIDMNTVNGMLWKMKRTISRIARDTNVSIGQVEVEPFGIMGEPCDVNTDCRQTLSCVASQCE